jgi:hypothetical protein
VVPEVERRDVVGVAVDDGGTVVATVRVVAGTVVDVAAGTGAGRDRERSENDGRPAPRLAVVT